jgi:hypothetical protein
MDWPRVRTVGGLVVSRLGKGGMMCGGCRRKEAEFIAEKERVG